MEQADTCKAHCHMVSVTCIDDVIITDGATGLRNISHTGALCTLNIVTKREKGVACQGNAAQLLQPVPFLFFCKRLRFLFVKLLPHAGAQNGHIVV